MGYRKPKDHLLKKQKQKQKIRETEEGWMKIYVYCIIDSGQSETDYMV